MWGTNSRRTILKVAAALGTVGTVGIGTAQAAEHGDEPEDGGPDVTGEIAASADEVFWLLLDQEGLHVEDPWRAVIGEDGDAGNADDGTPEDGTPEDGTPEDGADEGEPAADAQDGQPTGTNPTLELEEGAVYVLSWYNNIDSAKVEIEGDEGADGADDGDEEVDVEAEDDEDDEAEDARLRKASSVLTLLDENGEEVVRSDGVISGESGAIVFTATTDLATYREELTEAEGDIQVGDAAEAADDAAEEDDEAAADEGDEAAADEGEDEAEAEA